MTLREYVKKARGGGTPPPRVDFKDICWSFLGSFIGIGLCGYFSSHFFEPRDTTLLVASFGASAVLVYGAVKSPFAQPRNLIGGHVLSALIGVGAYYLFGSTWIGAAIAVSFAVSVMLLTHTLHPPGGATALLAVIGSAQIHKIGFLYAVLPIGLGAVILLFIAIIINNLSHHRRYPEYWF
jgi:CBS-domain-containing membrane protein